MFFAEKFLVAEETVAKSNNGNSMSLSSTKPSRNSSGYGLWSLKDLKLHKFCFKNQQIRDLCSHSDIQSLFILAQLPQIHKLTKIQQAPTPIRDIKIGIRSARTILQAPLLAFLKVNGPDLSPFDPGEMLNHAGRDYNRPGRLARYSPGDGSSAVFQAEMDQSRPLTRFLPSFIPGNRVFPG
nr:hypothetical protein Iba_chr01dCG9950 [Ipomoea batatas]